MSEDARIWPGTQPNLFAILLPFLVLTSAKLKTLSLGSRVHRLGQSWPPPETGPPSIHGAPAPGSGEAQGLIGFLREVQFQRHPIRNRHRPGRFHSAAQAARSNRMSVLEGSGQWMLSGAPARRQGRLGKTAAPSKDTSLLTRA